MDPVGPWSYPYNRLAGVQPGASGEFVHHLTNTANSGLGGQHPGVGVPSTNTTSHLLLQAAHSSSGPPFNPGPPGFLSPPVNYDSVFTPLFHHAGNPKPAHYSSTINAAAVAQHRLAQASVISKPLVEAELLRDNYSNQQSLSAVSASSSTTLVPPTIPPPSSSSGTHFDQNSGTASNAAQPSIVTGLAWQPNSQMPSPFGVLPHENIITSSPGPSSTSTILKSSIAAAAAAATYENFNTHFVAAQSLNQLKNTNSLRSISPQISNSQKHTNNSSFYSNNLSNTNNHQYSGSSDSVSSISNYSSGGAGASVSVTPPTTSNSKSFSTISTGIRSSSHSCIVTSVPISSSSSMSPLSSSSSSSSTTMTKDYHIPSNPQQHQQHSLTRTTSLTPSSQTNLYNDSSSSRNVIQNHMDDNQHNSNKNRNSDTRSSQQNFAMPPSNNNNVIHQTKGHSKLYSSILETAKHHINNNNNGVSDELQSSPISYSIIDLPGRLNYAGSNSSATKLLTNNRNNVNSISNNSNNIQYQQSASLFRHYQSNNIDPDYNRTKANSSTESQYSSSSNHNNDSGGGDSSHGGGGNGVVVVPRRPSPLQINSQASPLGHVPSPAYPMYNSPIMNTITSPQHNTTSHTEQHQLPYKIQPASRSPTTGSNVSRPQQTEIVYPSVITKALGIESCKNYQSTILHQNHENTSWELSNNRQSQQAIVTSNLHLQQQQQLHFLQRPSYELNQSIQDLTNCRGDPMSIVRNLQTLQHQSSNVEQPVLTPPSPATITKAPKTNSRKKKNNNSANVIEQQKTMKDIGETRSSSPINDYITNRIPPPAHGDNTSIAPLAIGTSSLTVLSTPTINTNGVGGGTYYDFERWNLPPPSQPPKLFSPTSPGFTPSSTNFSHQHNQYSHSHAQAPPIPYFSQLHLANHPAHSTEYQTVDTTSPATVSYNSHNNVSPNFTNLNNKNNNTKTNEDEQQPKVVVPNIEDELGFLAENNRGQNTNTVKNQHQQHHQSSSQNQQQQQHQSSSQLELKKFNIPQSENMNGFMGSYLKFLQGDRDTSPPPASRGGRKATWSRSQTVSTVTSSNNSPTTATKTTATSSSASTSSSSSNNNNSSRTNDIHKIDNGILQQQSQQDDQRYYPATMAKERKRKQLDTSEGNIKNNIIYI